VTVGEQGVVGLPPIEVEREAQKGGKISFQLKTSASERSFTTTQHDNGLDVQYVPYVLHLVIHY
jgi:hypothetical protein